MLQDSSTRPGRPPGFTGKSSVPDNFFLEIQDHGFEEQRIANRELVKIHRKWVSHW